MKNNGEFNEIRINNPDGILKQYEEGLRYIKYGDPRFIKEDPMANQPEVGKTPKTANATQNTTTSPNNVNPANLTADSLTNVTANATNVASTAASGAATIASGAVSVTTTIGSTIGAIAGVVATSVATAVIVVAVFISTLSINLSLVMADIDTLVIQIEMQGAQEEDFETPIIAVLEGGEGERYEQSVTIDTLYLTFNNLTPNTEYVIRVQNEEKVFAERSFFTAKERQEKGYIFAYVENDEVFVIVEQVVLKSDEFYTVTAKDEQGKVIFATDSAKENDEFRFSLKENKNLYFTLAVGGTTYAVYQLETEFGPVYDFNDYAFAWTDNFDASISFAEISGGEALVLPATVTGEVTVIPTCESDGEKLFTATVIYNDREYSGIKTMALAALGHEYGAPTFAWTPVYSGDGPGNVDTSGPITSDATPIGYTATAVFTCARDSEHTVVINAEISYADTAATCESDGYRTYTATVNFNDENYYDNHVMEFEGTATDHDFSQYEGEKGEQPEFTWTPDSNGGYTVTATFYCNNDPTHTQVIDAEVIYDDSIDCENGGTVYYTASVSYNDYDYQDELDVEVAAGHNLVPVFTWSLIDMEYDVQFYMVCTREDYCSEGVTANVTSTVEEDYILYTATVTYDNVEYADHKKEAITDKELAVGATYFLGDMMEIGEYTVYFTDDFDGAHRSNMSGLTYLDSVLRAGEDGGSTSLSEESNLAPVLYYDRIIFTNETYARIYDDGNLHGLGYYEFSWIFTESDDDLIGVTIVSGSGTENDPYVLAPVYGVTVTYSVPDGIFYSDESNVRRQYYTAEEIANGAYVVPLAETPQADMSGTLFLGWFIDEYATEKFDFDNTVITESITLYAGWIAV